MIKAFILLSSLCLGGAVFEWGALPCDGCGRDDMIWGGGSVNELWVYEPGPGDDDGSCLDNCTWDKPCKYTGDLTFTNNGAAAREVVDDDGNVVAPNVPGGGGSWSGAVNVHGGCGAVGDAAETYEARPVGGGARTSAYVFLCTLCS